jgi:1-pyrroline-5-carboxylate dehydrogenase
MATRILPFLAVVRVGSLDEALREANDVVYGLTAGVFGEDDAEVQRFLDESGSTGKGSLGPNYVKGFMREQSQTVAT